MPQILNDIEYLETLVEQKPSERGAQTVVEAIHGRRIMPPGTPLPGIVNIYRTPYLLEPMQNMSPSSPIKRTTIMKSVQSAVTWMAENIMSAWLLYWPTKILYLTATKEALTKWTKRLEPLITSIGLRKKIVSSNTDRKTRTTGDKALSKTFHGGGALEMGSLQSPSDLASDSVQVAIADEIDRAPEQLKSGEGNFLRVLAGRLEAFLWKAKLLVFSTPTTWEASLIYKEFKLGDQREYFVPCKHCGHMFFMTFKMLVPEFDKNNMLETVWLRCPKCGGRHVNSDKTWMLDPENGAEWRPQAIPSSKYHRSYHISKMMVPVGLATWTNIYQEYLNAKAVNDMGPFVNLQLGLPFKETGVRPKLEAVMELKGAYHSREIPFGVLFLTCALDVQQGSKTDPNKPPRLEMEILGHGSEFRTWSIEYKVFTGRIWKIDKKSGEMLEVKGGAAEAEKVDKSKYEIEYDLGIDNPYKGAYSELHDWAVENFVYTRSDGMKFQPKIVFIDSGDPITMQAVYAFCQRPEWKNTFPIKGRGVIKRKAKGETGDAADDNSMIRYRPHRSAETREIEFYNISTWHYKAHLFNNLNVKREPIDPQGPRFCDFPQDYSETYFKQLTANEKRPDGSFHDIPGQACEALDIRVYGLCAADVWLASRMVWYRKQMLAGQAKRPVPKRRSQFEIDEMIDFKYTLRMLERETARRELK
jgi:phage terminase large subunit GpA-like protein